MPSKTPTALITGCGRQRLGHVIAEHLAKLGHNIAVHYRSAEEGAKQNAATYRALGVQAKSFQADVTEEKEVQDLVQNVLGEFGTIDVLINTSSIWRSIPLENVSAEDVLRSFQVNTLGTFLCSQHAGLAMVAQESGGHIITIGDSLVDHPYLDHAAYFTAKGSIEALTKSFAVELAQRNPKVRVNGIAPGPVMFPDHLDAADRKRVTQSTLSKVANDPAAVARTVEYLLQCSMITGEMIRVDAGRNVGREQQSREGFGKTP